MARKQARYSSLIDDGEMVTDNTKENALHQEVHLAIAQLPRKSQELLTMRYFNNMSYKQMSEISGLTIAAVNTRLNRAKKKLAKMLQQTIDVEDRL